jgi:hypothetical protein
LLESARLPEGYVHLDPRSTLRIRRKEEAACEARRNPWDETGGIP